MAKKYVPLAVCLAASLAVSTAQHTRAADKELSAHDLLERSSHVFNDLAKKATPAVVSISAVKAADPEEAGFPFDSPFDQGPGSPDGGEMDGTTLGIGSGIVIRSDGLILTNYHVIEKAEKITVSFDEKHKTSATVVGADSKTDLAVIKADSPPPRLPVLTFGDSDRIQVGDWTVAIGSPFGLRQTVTSGIISAKGRGQMGMLDIEDFIQTDAAINPGNSGGPLLNAQGELIGVNTAIFSQSGGFIGIGFAIPSKIAKQVTDELIAHGRVIRGWVGVSAQDLDEDLAKFFHVPSAEGAVISQVVPKGPANEAKLRAGDVVVEFNQRQIHTSSDFKSMVAKTKAGAKVPVSIYRDGKSRTIALHIREQPRLEEALQLAGQAAPDEEKPSLGLAVQDIPPEFARAFDMAIESGALIVGVRPGSPAFEAGLEPGDIILKANHRTIRDAKEFGKVAREFPPTRASVLYVQRGPEEKIFVPVKPLA
jgi:serine protease Do